MPYNRPWLSFADQLQKLEDRGMQVTDRASAIDYLERVGYYRLSGYWYPYRTNQPPPGKGKADTFTAGTRFTDALALYVFDKKLRLLALDALERIEISIRVDIAHLLGKYDTFAYTNPYWLDGKFCKPAGSSRYDKWCKRYDGLVAQSKESFITHYKTKYGLPLPIWVSIEVWDFGLMSVMFAGMKGKDRDAIGAQYGVNDGHIFATWLRSLNYLRNLCAHHSRLWNRNMVDQAKLPDAAAAGDLAHFIGNAHAIARPFMYFSILQWFMRQICPNSHWHQRFKEHLQNFPNDGKEICTLNQMGCLTGWETWTLWK